MSPNSNRTRRTFVKALGTGALTATVAGCLEKSDDENESTDDAPLDDAGEPPEEHIKEFYILEIEFIHNSKFEIRFQNEGDQPADLANYDVKFDQFGSRKQYTGTVTSTPTSTDTTLDACAYGKVTFDADVGLERVSTFDVRVVCNGTPEAVYCDSS